MDTQDTGINRTSLEQQLAEALEEKAKLRQWLENCAAARNKAEQESALRLEASKNTQEELRQFSYSASHDLKEPLRSVSINAQLLQRHYSGDERAIEFTSFILDAVERMNSLLEALLIYSTTGPPAKRGAVDLKSVVQWALFNLDRSIKETRAEITFDELPVLAVDENQLVQVFQHLLSNSLKYRSSDEPKIHVSSQEELETYTISVRDNGIGIDTKYQEQIFGAFKRLHGREVAGTGLGLALCRKIIEGHGGRIWVESDGQHGSVFRFTLPA